MSKIAVRMLTYVSGGRHDGTSWPVAGTVLVLPEAEARDLIRAEIAVEVPMPEKTPEPAPDPAPEPASEPARGPEPGPVVAPETGQPAPADPKQVWIDYAVSQGLSPDEAAAMTKADLMSRYGGRL